MKVNESEISYYAERMGLESYFSLLEKFLYDVNS